MRVNRRGAPRLGRSYKKHGEVVKLAAQLAGCSVWSVYKVLNGRSQSARVSLALHEARLQLAAAAERAA